MGLFSIVNPNNTRAVALASDVCQVGMDLVSQTDNHTSEKQQFYLGQHGPIFSKCCLELVILANEDDTAKVQTFRLGTKTQTWKFVNGRVESVAFPGKIIASDGASGEVMVLQSNHTASNQQWKRCNTRLLTLTANQSEWKQNWTMSFISSSPRNISLEEFERGNNLATTCYKLNPVFSKAFDDFAKELVIVDPKDEEKCGEVREELGFDRDHQFDTEVREKFHEHMCDQFLLELITQDHCWRRLLNLRCWSTHRLNTKLWNTAGIPISETHTKYQFCKQPEGLRPFRDHRWKALGEENSDLSGLFLFRQYFESYIE